MSKRQLRLGGIAFVIVVCVGGWFISNWLITIPITDPVAAAEQMAREFPPVGQKLQLLSKTETRGSVICLLYDESESQLLVIQMYRFFGGWQKYSFDRIKNVGVQFREEEGGQARF